MRCFLLISITIGMFACSSAEKVTQSSVIDSGFNGEWTMKGAFMFDSILVFNRVDESVKRPEYEEVYVINDGDLKHEIRTEFGMCGNGLFYLDSASISQKKQKVNIILDGGYMVESTFMYDADFSLIEFAENSFVLELIKVNKEESKSLYN